MANINISQILIKRGNTAAASNYVGPLGELLVDTGLKTVRVQDGVTPGGMAVLATLAGYNQLSANIANLQTAVSTISGLDTGFIGNINTLLSNTVTQQTQINSIGANLSAFETYANLTFGTSNYGNAQVAAYLTANPQGGNYSDANVVALLGNYSNAIQWTGGSQVYEDTVLVAQGAAAVAITSPGSTQITAGTNTWTFDADAVTTLPGKLSFPYQGTNQRTGWAESLVFVKSNDQKSIATSGGTVDVPTVERLVIAGGDSYYDGSAFTGEGGDIYLWAGRGANGGDIKIDAGNALGPNYYDQGGTIKIRGGSSSSGTGGFVHIESGSGVTGGEIQLTTPGYTWQFNNDGTLNLPLSAIGADTTIKYGMGNLVVYNDGGWALGVYNGSNFGTEGMRLSPGIEGNVEVILPADQDAATESLKLNNYSTGGVQIRSHNNYWIFSNVGELTVPGTVVTQYGNIESGTIGPGLTLMSNVDAGQYFNGFFVGNTDNNQQTYMYAEQSQAVVGVTNTTTNQLNVWTFNDDASISAPGDLNIVGNINFSASPAGAITGASLISAQELYSSGNVTVGGNLIINGSAATIATSNLIIDDNIIYMANANPANSLDIGFAGHFTSGTYQHTGLVRQASTGQWKLFSNLVPEPGNTLDFTNAIYDAIQVGAITSPTIADLYTNAAVQASGITSANTAIITANTAMKGYVDAVSSAWTANAATQQGLISSLQSNAAIQETEISGLRANITAANLLIAAATGTYSNSNVAAYLSAQTTGNVGAGNLTVINNFTTNTITANSFNYANGVSILSGITGTYSNTNVAAYLTTQTFYSNSNIASYLVANPQAGTYSNVNVAAYIAGNLTAINANIAGANAAIVTANTAMKLYVDAKVLGSSTTGNITFSGYTISTQNDPYGAVGITLNPANGGEIHIDSYTGINNNNPGYWLHVGDGSIGAVNNTGNVSIDFNDGSDAARGSAILDWAWWDAASNGNNNRGTGPHTHFGIYKNDDTHNTAWLEFDATTGNATIGNLRPTGIYTNSYFYANGVPFALNTLDTISTTGNVSVGGNLAVTRAVTVSGDVTATGNITSPNLTSKTTGSWTVTTGTNTYSITVPASGTYQIWVRGNIPNGIITYLATVVVTNTNVPVLGTQYAWVYSGGGTPIDFTSIPTQLTGTGNTIVRSSTSPSATTNRFDFGINNSSGSSQTVQWGYVTLG